MEVRFSSIRLRAASIDAAAWAATLGSTPVDRYAGVPMTGGVPGPPEAAAAVVVSVVGTGVAGAGVGAGAGTGKEGADPLMMMRRRARVVSCAAFALGVGCCDVTSAALAVRTNDGSSSADSFAMRWQ